MKKKCHDQCNIWDLWWNQYAPTVNIHGHMYIYWIICIYFWNHGLWGLEPFGIVFEYPFRKAIFFTMQVMWFNCKVTSHNHTTSVQVVWRNMCILIELEMATETHTHTHTHTHRYILGSQVGAYLLREKDLVIILCPFICNGVPSTEETCFVYFCITAVDKIIIG